MASAIGDWYRVRNSSGKSSGKCQLCGHTGYSYSYIIKHRESGVELLIGSKCAENFWPLMMPMLPQPRTSIMASPKSMMPKLPQPRTSIMASPKSMMPKLPPVQPSRLVLVPKLPQLAVPKKR